MLDQQAAFDEQYPSDEQATEAAISTEAASEAMNALLAAHELADAGPMAHAATDAQKWAVGDVVGRMQDVIARAETRLLSPKVRATSEDRAAFRDCLARYDEFVGSQGVRRGTLVDYASVAKAFPPDGPLRALLPTFSHARAISRVDSAEDQVNWIARVRQDGPSVRSLQFEINAVSTPKPVAAVTPPPATTVSANVRHRSDLSGDNTTPTSSETASL